MWSPVCVVRATSSLLGLMCLWLAPQFASAQAHTEWYQFANGAGGTELEWTDVITLPSGLVVACGTEHTMNQDLVVQAWNPNGSVAWIYRYPDPGDQTREKSGKLASLNGEVFVTGSHAYALNGWKDDFLIIRLNPSGGQISSNTFSIDTNGMHDVVDGIAVRLTDLYVTGHLDDGVAFKPGFVLRMTFGLAPYWTAIFGQGVDYQVHPPMVLPNGSVAVVATDRYFGRQATTLRLFDAGGLLLRQRTYPGPNTTASNCLTGSPSGDVYLATRSLSTNTITVDRYDSNLNLLGSLPITDYNYDSAAVTWCEPTQSLYFCANRYVDDMIEARCYTPAGMQIWAYSQPNNTTGLRDYRIASDRFGNFAVMGTHEFANGDINFAAWMWDRNGVPQWKNELSGTPQTDELPNAFAIDDQLRFYVVGRSTDANGVDQGAIWRTSQFFRQRPSLVVPRLGRRVVGSLASVHATDGLLYGVARFPKPNSDNPIAIEFESTFPIDNVQPGATTLELEVVCSASIGGHLETIQLWDWTVSDWGEQVTRTSSQNSQTILLLATNVSRYFEPGTRRVRARAVFHTVGNVSVLLLANFIDFVEWRSSS